MYKGGCSDDAVRTAWDNDDPFEDLTAKKGKIEWSNSVYESGLGLFDPLLFTFDITFWVPA